MSKILKKVDRQKQGKTPQNSSQTVSHTFKASVVLRDENVCDSFTHIHALFSTIWVREDLVKFWAQIRTFPLFSVINFFQNFRHDFSRFLHVWLIFRTGENRKNVKNLDHEEPDPRSEFKACERCTEALSGKKGFLCMILMKKIFEFGYGYKNSESPEKWSLNQKKWRSQRGK